MAECPIDITVTDNGDGTHTITNPNSVAATVDVTPSVAPFPITLQANGSQTVTVPHPGTTSGTFCYSVSADCQSGSTHSIEIQNLVLNPNQAEYTPGEDVVITLDGVVTGNTAVDDFTIELVHDDITEPTLVCPTGVITDPTTFSVDALIPEPAPFGASTVHVDLRINYQGLIIDPGLAPIYIYPGSGILTIAYDLTQSAEGAQLLGQQGQFILSDVYWYDGDNDVLIPSLLTCIVDFDFTGF